MTRQRTVWEFSALDAVGGGIRVGRVFNPKWRYKPDVVRLQINARQDFIDLHMTMDEAVVVAAGLTKVVAKELWNRGALDCFRKREEPGRGKA